MDSPKPDLQEIHDYLIQLAKKAGQLVTSARPSLGAIDTKKNSSDLVTETDKAVESLISASLRGAFPAASFLGEESHAPGARLSDAPTFVVDPIDGTTNFVHGHPYVSISMAYCRRKRPLVGIVYNPFTGALYHGIKGRGAFLTTALPAGAEVEGAGAGGTEAGGAAAAGTGTGTGKRATELTRRLPLRPPEALAGIDKALVCVEWGNEREGRNWAVKTATFAALAGAPAAPGGGKMAHSLRSLGSAALNMCGVAAGELDAYWEGGAYAWDVAAGWVLLEEAGGMVVGANPGEWEAEVDGRRYLAVRGARGGGEEARAFVEEFWGCVRGRLEYEL